MEKKCGNCENSTKNKTFCSLSCKNSSKPRTANYVKINCKICEKEFEATERKVNNGKKYCSVKCQHEGSRVLKSKRIKLKCLFCENEFEKTENKVSYGKSKYCSRVCKDTHQKEIYQKEGNPVYGTQHSEERIKQLSDSAKKMWKSDSHRKKVKEGQKNFMEINGYWLGTDDYSKSKRKETYLKKYGVDHNWKVKEIHEKCNITSVKNTGLTTHEIARKELLRKKETSIEIKIKEILTNNNIVFKKNFTVSFSGGNRFYDFYLKDYNLLIEADGDYWHSNPLLFKILNEAQQKNKLNDEFKNELAKKNGYNLVRFWEIDINKIGFESVILNEIKKWKIK